jgi:hypothetical protein
MNLFQSIRQPLKLLTKPPNLPSLSTLQLRNEGRPGPGYSAAGGVIDKGAGNATGATILQRPAPV